MRASAKVARAALAKKRERGAEEWKMPAVPAGFPARPLSVVDYIVDFVNPVTGQSFRNYSVMARALGTSRQTVHQWKDNDHIPDKYLTAIMMQTGINPAVLMVWNSMVVGRPKDKRG
jgi:hypothetical protein